MTGETVDAAAEVRFTQVLVPLDGSTHAQAALPVAVALADRLGAQVHVVTVSDDVEVAVRIASDVDPLLDDLGIDAQRFAVVADEDPVRGIERRVEALGSALVCMSTHGHGRFAGAVIGSVTREVLERSRAPIVVVGAPDERLRPFGYVPPALLEVRRLVVCVDGSPVSEAVLAAACGWARALGMALTILTVAEPTPPPLSPENVTYGGYGTDADAASYVARLATRWRDCVADVTGDVVYDPISPSDGLRGHLDDEPAGMVAVMTNAHQGWRRVVQGDTAADIVRIAGVPVLVVPGPTTK